jgi:hypothetical protein
VVADEEIGNAPWGRLSAPSLHFGKHAHSVSTLYPALTSLFFILGGEGKIDDLLVILDDSLLSRCCDCRNDALLARFQQLTRLRLLHKEEFSDPNDSIAPLRNVFNVGLETVEELAAVGRDRVGYRGTATPHGSCDGKGIKAGWSRGRGTRRKRVKGRYEVNQIFLF